MWCGVVLCCHIRAISVFRYCTVSLLNFPLPLLCLFLWKFMSLLVNEMWILLLNLQNHYFQVSA